MVIHLTKYFLEGFIIGLGKIIPGVSGALFAMLFGVYESILECITNPKTIILKYKIIIPLILGIIFAIMFGSKIILLLLEYFYVTSMAFFLGIMSYGLIPLLRKNKNNHLNNKEIFSIIIFSLVIIILMFLPVNYNIIVSVGVFRDVISLFLCGILDAIATIIPGISGTALLMLVGYYEIIISSLSNFNIFVLIPFLFGLFVGIIYLAKVINYAFKYHKNLMNGLILSFSFLSIMVLLLELFCKITVNDILPFIIAFILGFILSYILEEKLS